MTEFIAEVRHRCNRGRSPTCGVILAAADLRGIANSPVLTNLLDQPLGLI